MHSAIPNIARMCEAKLLAQLNSCKCIFFTLIVVKIVEALPSTLGLEPMDSLLVFVDTSLG